MTVSSDYFPHSYFPGAAMAAESLADMPFFAKADLIVRHEDGTTGDLTELVEGVDFTIGGMAATGLTTAGTITALAEWPVDDVFHVERRTDLRQAAQWEAFEHPPALDLQRVLDIAVLAAQEARVNSERATPLPAPPLMVVQEPGQANGSVARTVAAALREQVTFEGAGCVGDNATLDTVKAQALATWAAANGRTIHMMSRQYLVSNIVMPANLSIRGDGRQWSIFRAAPGTVGAWFRAIDANKIELSGIGFYGNDEPGLTKALELGVTGIPYGTEGVIRDLWVRNVPNGIGLDLVGNVGIIESVSALECATNLKIYGNANIVRGLVSANASVCGLDVAGSCIDGLELEAMPTGSVPVKMKGDVLIDNVWLAIGDTSSLSHIFEVDTGSYDHWRVANVRNVIDPPKVIVTNQIMKVAGVYRGGTDVDTFAGSSADRTLDHAARRRPTEISVTIFNDGGVLRHRIGSYGESAVASNFADRIVAANPAYQATATGAAAFVAGASILADGQTFVFDVADQAASESAALAAMAIGGGIVAQTTGTWYSAQVSISSNVVAGVTRRRLTLKFLDVAGAVLTLSAIPSTKTITVGLRGLLA